MPTLTLYDGSVLNLSVNEVWAFDRPMEIREVNMKNFNVKVLPDCVGNWTHVQKVDFSFNLLEELPECVGAWSQIQTVKFYVNNLTVLPESVGAWTQVHTIDFTANQLKMLPDSIGAWIHVQNVILPWNKLTVLPDSIGAWTQIQNVNLINNELTVLPKSIGAWTQVKNVGFSYNQLTVLSECMEAWNQIKNVNFSCNKLKMLPECVGAWTQIQKVNFSDNELYVLPESVGAWKLVQKVNFTVNQLTVLPESVGAWTQVQKVYFNFNRLIMLPIQMLQWINIHSIQFYDNPLILSSPLQRWLDRINNARTHDGVYTDSQNVHTSSLQTTVKHSIFALLNDPPVSFVLTEELLKLHSILSRRLFEFCDCKEPHSELLCTFSDVLEKVLARIFSSTHREELLGRLQQEMEEADCKCFTGRMSRLVNSLSGGYFDDIHVGIGENVQIANVILRIHNEVEGVERQKEQVVAELTERGFSSETIAVWVEGME